MAHDYLRFKAATERSFKSIGGFEAESGAVARSSDCTDGFEFLLTMEELNACTG